MMLEIDPPRLALCRFQFARICEDFFWEEVIQGSGRVAFRSQAIQGFKVVERVLAKFPKNNELIAESGVRCAALEDENV
jgi:hypothetical protein